MGFLELPGGGPNLSIPDHSKAVISLWFRIPSSTFAVMSSIPYPLPFDYPGLAGDEMNSAYYNPPLYKIIPLITFGSVETDDFANPIQPSFIGVDCIFDGINALACCLQTPIKGTVVSSFGNTGPARPGCFYMSGWVDGPGFPANTYCAPDKWHHILISYDIGGNQSANYDTAGGTHLYVFTSDSTFTWALDDASKVGLSMTHSGGGNWAPYGLADNQIITNWLVDSVGFGGDPSHGLVGDVATFSGGFISSVANPVGIPASTNFTTNVQKVEMAELQFFTGISIDTTILVNRRLFVTADGFPVDPLSAEAGLGKAPDILLTGQSNWIAGTNTGTAGNFNPLGSINPFTPGPQIGA